MVPYSPRSDEKWSLIHMYNRVMVAWVVRNGPNIYLDVDTDPLIYRPAAGRSITVDIDGRLGSTYRRIRLISTVDRIHLQRITVDRRWWIKIRDDFVVGLIDGTC